MTRVLAASFLAAFVSLSPASAEDGHAPQPPRETWSFAGIFGKIPHFVLVCSAFARAAKFARDSPSCKVLNKLWIVVKVVFADNHLPADSKTLSGKKSRPVMSKEVINVLLKLVGHSNPKVIEALQGA